MMCRLQQQLLRFTSSVPAEAMQGDERSLGGLTLQDSSSSRSESGRQAMELEDVFAASGLQKGAPWPQLTRLLVSNATAEGFALLLLVCSNLRCLQVSSRGLASDTVLVACLEVAAPTQLQELSLPALSTSAGRVLSRTVSLTIPSLKQLSFTGPASLSMELLEAFRSAEVESLAFRRCDSIDNQLLCQGIGSISSLRQLELIGCDCVDGDALVSIAGQLPQLTRLVVLACARVGPDAGRAWECAAAAAARAAAGSGGVGGRRAPKQELLFADALAAVRE
jgi:hypothetical protein